MTLFRLIFLMLLFIGCDNYSYSIYHKDIELPSGKHFKVLNFERQYSKKIPTVVLLEYETDLAIDDTEGLRNQVLEIWKVFKSEAEAEPFTKVVIAPKKTLSALGSEVTNWRSYNFDKNEDGVWIIP